MSDCAIVEGITFEASDRLCSIYQSCRLPSAGAQFQNFGRERLESIIPGHRRPGRKCFGISASSKHSSSQDGILLGGMVAKGPLFWIWTVDGPLGFALATKMDLCFGPAFVPCCPDVELFAVVAGDLS